MKPKHVPVPAPIRVAYHDGPPEIVFLGLTWRRGVAQAVTPDEWAAMRARGDFHQFDFRAEAAEPAAPITPEE